MQYDNLNHIEKKKKYWTDVRDIVKVGDAMVCVSSKTFSGEDIGDDFSIEAKLYHVTEVYYDFFMLQSAKWPIRVNKINCNHYMDGSDVQFCPKWRYDQIQEEGLEEAIKLAETSKDYTNVGSSIYPNTNPIDENGQQMPLPKFVQRSILEESHEEDLLNRIKQLIDNRINQRSEHLYHGKFRIGGCIKCISEKETQKVHHGNFERYEDYEIVRVSRKAMYILDDYADECRVFLHNMNTHINGEGDQFEVI